MSHEMMNSRERRLCLWSNATCAMPVVGFLNSLSPEALRRPVAAFHEGLKEAGYVEGRNVAIEYQRLPALAADLEWSLRVL